MSKTHKNEIKMNNFLNTFAGYKQTVNILDQISAQTKSKS